VIAPLRSQRRKRRPETAEVTGLLLARLAEGLLLLDAVPDGAAVYCRKCGVPLGVVAGPSGYATCEAHDVVTARYSHGEPEMVGRSPLVMRRGKGVLLRRCLDCGHANRIFGGKCK